MTAPPDLAGLYAAALREHVLRSSEPALHQAYELGRRALADGVGVLDLSLLHHDVLAQLLRDGQLAGDAEGLELASAFLAECLSPFEMTLRGYRETNARLGAANAELVRVNATLEAAHEQLSAEIEERRKAEEALAHAQKLQAIGLLAGGVAHHFNNMLTVVIGNLELARQRLGGDARVDRLLAAARRGADRAAEVTRQLLSFSRQQILKPRRIDPAAWLADVRSLLSGALRGDIAIDTVAEIDAPVFEADPAQLDLALLNLAVNAQDAMPHGGTLTLRVARRVVDDGRLGLSGACAVVEVQDSGVGIAPDLLPKVFDPFFSTKDAGPGAGLGLSQVHGFAHQSGGAVEIESTPGQGTLVRLYLPAADQPSEAAAPEAAQEAKPAVAGAGRILVVEDDVDVASLACSLIESLGYSVRLAGGARTALDLIQGGEPVDLVFSDVMMPGGMDGVQLADAVRQRFPKLPVLLTSGYNDALDRLQQEGLTFIAKPYRREDLYSRLAQLLRRAG